MIGVLVREALKERRILIKNAPHLVHSKPFILPCYKKGEREFYTVGLGIYSAMTYGGYNIGRTSSPFSRRHLDAFAGGEA